LKRQGLQIGRCVLIALCLLGFVLFTGANAQHSHLQQQAVKAVGSALVTDMLLCSKQRHQPFIPSFNLS